MALSPVGLTHAQRRSGDYIGTGTRLAIPAFGSFQISVCQIADRRVKACELLYLSKWQHDLAAVVAPVAQKSGPTKAFQRRPALFLRHTWYHS